MREQPVPSQLGQRFLSLLKNTESRFDPLRDLPLVVDWMPAPTKYPRIEDVALVQRRVILIPILAIFHTTIRWTLTHFMSLKRRREIAGSASRALQGRARASICAQDVGSGKKRSRLVVPRNEEARLDTGRINFEGKAVFINNRFGKSTIQWNRNIPSKRWTSVKRPRSRLWIRTRLTSTGSSSL